MHEHDSPSGLCDEPLNAGPARRAAGLEWLLAGLLLLGLLSGAFLFLSHARRNAEVERAFWVD